MEEKLIKLTIDNHEVEVPQGTTLLEAGKLVGIDIPTLCHIDLKGTCVKNKPASCRLCVVEVEGRRNLAPACATNCTPGMVVYTNSARVIRARKTVAELILSDHPNDCLTCPKCSDCELQRLVMRLNIRQMPYNQGEKSQRKNEVTPAITRNMEKCIYCRRCESVCNNVQSVGVLGAIRRGFDTTIAPTFDRMFTDTDCTYCGQCVAVCPVGALTERDYTDQLLDDLTNPDKVVVAQPAPAVRFALGEEFGMKPGTSVTGKMATALRDLGFDYAFDTDFGADLTIMDEGAEILDRLGKFLNGDKSVKLPIMTSCCPAWVNFYEHNYPDLLDYPSSAKSPAQMFGAIAKTYWAEKMGIPREKLVVVSIMPCLAKKYECGREEFKVNGNPDVDYSISTRELARLIKRANINFAQLPESEFDSPMGESTGAAAIFGVTGGVMEAALRTVYEVYTGKTLPHINFENVRGFDGIREATIDLNGFELKVCVAHTLSNARIIMDKLRAGELNYHVVEVMACPSGCIGGAGQPYHHGNIEILKARRDALYAEDEGKKLRKSHENPDIQKLYNEFLGKPLSEKSHHLLHTHYFDKSIK
ncbi:MAG: iron hydrogenase small subunit [Muribaculaceae bacterium]|nr:iron hydrogenase small subunit [Muribaculaceae bacterium]